MARLESLPVEVNNWLRKENPEAEKRAHLESQRTFNVLNVEELSLRTRQSDAQRECLQ